jgi:hypothetical protein
LRHGEDAAEIQIVSEQNEIVFARERHDHRVIGLMRPPTASEYFRSRAR